MPNIKLGFCETKVKDGTGDLMWVWFVRVPESLPYGT